MDYLEIARELIRRESITGNEEPVAAYLEETLRGLGLDVRSQEVATGRRNLVAGPERPAVLFCTHMDTVPPYVKLREDAEFIYGRGACDTKGITACFLEAGRRLHERGVTDFGYLFLVGEEVDNVGAKAANESVRARYLIVGEPTENRLAIGHKGALGVRLQVTGKACHSAYPEQGDSALHRLLGILSRVLDTDFGRHEVLGPGTVNIGRIEGGVANNVLAPSAEATVFVRVVDSLEAADQRLERCLVDPRTGQRDGKVAVETIVRMGPPELERLDGFEETVVSYGTDTPFLADVGKALLFGPGSILDAHTDGEKISKREMAEAVERYVEMAERLGARG